MAKVISTLRQATRVHVAACVLAALTMGLLICAPDPSTPYHEVSK